uniref:Uncharacterized protein n=1 Tax=Meloidogyne javanica TaxID=6303 RepID=A0A915LI90_MELJA
MKIKFFVLLFIAIFIPLNIVAIRYVYDSEDDSFEERPSKRREVKHHYDYSGEYVEHVYYEDEEPEKPEPKPEEPKPEEPKPESTEKWTLDAKTVNKWEDQPEVSSAFEKIRGETEKVYNVSKWEKPIEDGKDKGKVKQKHFWHKALFLIDALFQLYAKVLSELTNLVDKNNEQVINEICADKVKDLDKEKKCSKGLEALVKMNKENIEKIDDFYKLHDNFGKEDKVTNAAETIYAFPKLFRDWLREKTSDWKEQPEATKAFNYIKEEITKSYSLKEEITRLNAQKNWPYHLFLLHTLFEFFESIFAVARKQISSKNNSVINQICVEKISEKESEKCVDWLNNLSKKLEKCNEKIGTDFEAALEGINSEGQNPEGQDPGGYRRICYD